MEEIDQNEHQQAAAEGAVCYGAGLGEGRRRESSREAMKEKVRHWRRDGKEKGLRGSSNQCWENKFSASLQLRTKRCGCDADTRATTFWSPRVSFAGVLRDSDRGGFGEREMEREEL
nr:unnamed protein product [Digitaria exilis]